jgi:uncharacterized membrane protein YfhO
MKKTKFRNLTLFTGLGLAFTEFLAFYFLLLFFFLFLAAFPPPETVHEIYGFKIIKKGIEGANSCVTCSSWYYWLSKASKNNRLI